MEVVPYMLDTCACESLSLSLSLCVFVCLLDTIAPANGQRCPVSWLLPSDAGVVRDEANNASCGDA